MVDSIVKPYAVRAVHCDHRSSDEEVYRALRRATDPLDRSWERLKAARRITVKFNQDWPADQVVMHAGHRLQLVSDSVGRATLRLLRERTTAELVAVDIGAESINRNIIDTSGTNMMGVFREFDVPYVDCTKVPTTWVDVPGGGLIFDRYPLPQTVVEADELISVQKMKNHAFMGVTLCLKNLFGLVSYPPDGRPRVYYHHLVRMPYLLADLGRILNPALSIIDGLVAQAGREWGPGEHPRICNTLVAGDQVVATDACGMTLMGHDPGADWPVAPFLRDRNAIVVAANAGQGTADLERIDFQSEVNAPLGEFFVKSVDTGEMMESWLRTTSEQALFYRDHRREFERQFTGQYILLQMNQVRWSGPQWDMKESRRILSGNHPEEGMWLKYVLPGDPEGEHFEVYEDTQRRTAGVGQRQREDAKS